MKKTMLVNKSAIKTDKDGKIVYSKLNEQTLKKVAESGKGAYFRWSSGQNNINKLFSMLDEIEKSEFTAQQLERLESQYQWFVFISLIIFLFVFTIARNW